MISDKFDDEIRHYMAYVECPFCHEKDFSEYGLKVHLLNQNCDVFENLKPDWKKIRKQMVKELGEIDERTASN